MKKMKKKTTQNKKKARCITGFLFVIYLFCCVTIFLKKKKKETHNSGENAFLGAIFHMYLSLKIIKFSFLFTMKLSVDSCLLFIVNPIIYCIIFIVVANHPSRFFFYSPSFSHFELRVNVICLFVFKQKIDFWESVVRSAVCVYICFSCVYVVASLKFLNWNWTIGSFRFSFYCKCVTIITTRKERKKRIQFSMSAVFFLLYRTSLFPGIFFLRRRDFHDLQFFLTPLFVSKW